MRITNSELQNKINDELKKTTNLYVVSDGVCKDGMLICKYDEILELFAGLHEVANVIESLTGVKVG